MQDLGVQIRVMGLTVPHCMVRKAWLKENRLVRKTPHGKVTQVRSEICKTCNIKIRAPTHEAAFAESLMLLHSNAKKLYR